MKHQKHYFSWLSKIDIQIWTAILGIFGTFVASPLALQLFSTLQLPAISDQRKKTFQGRWEGMGRQQLTEQDRQKLGVSGDVLDFPAHLNLNVQGRRINGTLDIVKLSYSDSPANGSNKKVRSNSHTLTEHKEVSYSVEGHMVASNYIRLDYASSDPGVVDFGTLMLKLPPVGGKLEGKYVSFGPITERLVNGEYDFPQVR